MGKSDITRLHILRHAFQLVYKQGYQATSIDEIIATTRVTKGAFFYHFKNKDAMGLAMVREVMYPGMQQALILPLSGSTDPVTDIYLMMKNLLFNNPFFEVKFGCPAINLIEEMATINKSFHNALSTLVTEWQAAIQASINNGRASGTIRKNVHAGQVAHFITAGYGGIRNMGKILGKPCYEVYLKELKSYLSSLH